MSDKTGKTTEEATECRNLRGIHRAPERNGEGVLLPAGEGRQRIFPPPELLTEEAAELPEDDDCVEEGGGAHPAESYCPEDFDGDFLESQVAPANDECAEDFSRDGSGCSREYLSESNPQSDAEFSDRSSDETPSGSCKVPSEPSGSLSSQSALDDGMLIAAYLAGDESALNQIIQRYHRPIYRMALRWSKNSDEADDLTQRTFLRMLKHLKNFQGNQLKSYLFRITANLCKNHLRDTAKFVFGIRDEPYAEPDDAEREAEEERVLLRSMIARLPSRQRQVVLLRIDGDQPFSEVARILGITENSAKVNFHHAIRRLKQLRIQEEAAARKIAEN